jgi:hypothetical protein
MPHKNTVAPTENLYKNSSKKEVVLVKLEALLNSFLEDDFLGYMFNKYGFFSSIKYLFYSIANHKKLQLKIQKELEQGNLLESLNFNNIIIRRIQDFIKKGHPVCLISTKYEAIVHSLGCYLNIHEFFGNKINQTLDFHNIFHKYSLKYEKKTRNKLNFIFISDEILFSISQKATILVQTGSLYKILWNFIWKKNTVFVPGSNTYNKSIFAFMALLKRRRLPNILGILVLPFVPLVEMGILIKALYLRVFIFIILMSLINGFIFPKFISMKIAILAIFESNNIINFYKIITAAYPVFQHEKSFRNYYLQEGLMKSYASLRIGLFIYCLISFIYFNNIFLLLIQCFYLCLFLTFPLRYAVNLYNYSWFFTIIQSSVYYLIIIH